MKNRNPKKDLKSGCQYSPGPGECSCRQRSWRYQLCRYHLHAAATPGFRHDPYYHGKIRADLLKPSHGFFTPRQLKAMFDTRTHGDGRKSDQWRVE